MKPETQEWIEKAEGNLKVARREGQNADKEETNGYTVARPRRVRGQAVLVPVAAA